MSPAPQGSAHLVEEPAVKTGAAGRRSTGRRAGRSAADQGEEALDGVLEACRGTAGAPDAPTTVGMSPSWSGDVAHAIHDERERIARDLHDSVVQRIFATAMSVDALRVKQPDRDDEAELAQIVGELDRCAMEIRSVIYCLSPDEVAGGLETDLLAVLEEARPALGLSPTVQFTGALGSVGGPWRHHLVAIFRELLSNVAQHAHASQVEIKVEVGEQIWVRVGDDGIGFDPAELRWGRGVRNLTQRATALGGSLLIHARPGGGTVVECLLPLPADHPHAVESNGRR